MAEGKVEDKSGKVIRHITREDALGGAAKRLTVDELTEACRTRGIGCTVKYGSCPFERCSCNTITPEMWSEALQEHPPLSKNVLRAIYAEDLDPELLLNGTPIVAKGSDAVFKALSDTDYLNPDVWYVDVLREYKLDAPLGPRWCGYMAEWKIVFPLRGNEYLPPLSGLDDLYGSLLLAWVQEQRVSIGTVVLVEKGWSECDLRWRNDWDDKVSDGVRFIDTLKGQLGIIKTIGDDHLELSIPSNEGSKNVELPFDILKVVGHVKWKEDDA